MPDGCAWRPRETCTSEFQGGNRRVRNPPVAGTASLFSDETSTILTGSLEARCRRTMRTLVARMQLRKLAPRTRSNRARRSTPGSE
jgi:hypothetical protein